MRDGATPALKAARIALSFARVKGSATSLICGLREVLRDTGKYRDDESAVAAAGSFVDGAGSSWIADGEEGSRDDAVENRSASVGRVRPLTMR
jgi:hypothetical protein